MNRTGNPHGRVTRLERREARRIALLLNRYRLSAFLTMGQVQDMTGVALKTIWTWESGYRACDVMSVAQLLTLLRCYGVTLAQFEADLTAKRKAA